MIQTIFPGQTITRMQERKRRGDRLDFDDEGKEMIREIWQAPYARKKLRQMLKTEAENALALYPPEKYLSEPFAQKVQELQQTLKLTDFELDVLLVLAFVRCDLLCIADGHNRRSDPNDKAEFIAKNLGVTFIPTEFSLFELATFNRKNWKENSF